MARSLSIGSRTHLDTCHPLLQKIVLDVLADEMLAPDIGVVCGHRNYKKQQEEYLTGDSQLAYPQSKHNATPSLAVDLVIYEPKYSYPYLWGIPENINSLADHYEVSTLKIKQWLYVKYVRLDCAMKFHARKYGVDLTWGGNWNKEDILETNFQDLFHWEISNVGNL